MGLDVKVWDQRIRKDLEHRMNKYDKVWKKNRKNIRNTEDGQLNGNLIQTFVDTIQSRLIVRNPVIKVKADSADYSKRSDDLEVAANAITRVVDLRYHLMNATITATWASTGWIEVGHTMDQHNFDPMRSVLYRSPDKLDFDPGVDSWEPVPEADVVNNLGSEIDQVPSFNPFDRPELGGPAASDDPPPPFDPEMGMPWLNEISPFMVVTSRDATSFRDVDYVTKLVLLSKPELELITNINVEGAGLAHKLKPLLEDIPGAKNIDDPILLAVTYIRRDRNNPDFTNWYLVHVLGHHDVVIKSSPNPFGGLIPLVPISVNPVKGLWDSTLVEDLRPYADWYSAGVQSIGDRLYESLNQKIVTGAGASMDAEEVKKLLNARYSGEVKVQGDPAQIKPYNGAGFDNEMYQFLKMFSNLAQGASGASNIDRGQAEKRITARQTGALLEATGLRMNGMRESIGRSSREIVVKLMHLVGIFSLYRSRRFTFGTRIATLEPGVNDFTTSYSYHIDVRDMAPPENAEGQLVLVQFLRLIMMDPTPERLLAGQWNWPELAEMIRVRFDMPPEVLQQVQQQAQMPQMPGMTGENISPEGAGPGGLGMLGSGLGGPEHAERFPADQGAPNLDNLMSGLRQQN